MLTMSEAVELMAKHELKYVAPVIFAWRHTRERWIIVNNLARIYVRNADLWYPRFTGHGDFKILLSRGFPLINCVDEERKHDVVIEWYDNGLNRINIDGFAVVAVLYPGRHILIHSRCCGNNEVMVYNKFKHLLERIDALNISKRDREYLIKAIKSLELIFG